MKKITNRLLSLALSVLLLFPLLPLPAAAEEFGEIDAAAALLVDVTHGLTLYEKNSTGKRYPASITKVMTAILVLEAIEDGRLTPDTMLTCSESARADITRDSSTQKIQVGEQMSVKDLLYCLLVSSANEASNILAEGVSGNIPVFVASMNAKAAELGMTGTRFMNPHGLHNDDHYSTAQDIVIMAQYAMEYPLFRDIVATNTYKVPETNMSDARQLYNTNALISAYRYTNYQYSYTTGIKTGNTAEAGFCLLSSAKRDGRTLIAVVLGAEAVTLEDKSIDRKQFSESRRLLQYGFSGYKVQTLISPDSLLTEVPVAYGKDVSYVVAAPADRIDVLLPADFDRDLLINEIQLSSTTFPAPISKNQVLGTIHVSYNGGEYGNIDLLAVSGVERSNLAFALSILSDLFGSILVKILLAVIFLFLIIAFIRSATRASKPKKSRSARKTKGQRESRR